MEFVPFNNVIKLEAIFLQDLQKVQNVHYYLVDETPNEDTARALAASYVAWFDTEMQNIVSSQVSLIKVVCTIMETETSPGIEYTTGLPISGGNLSPAMPNNVTVAVKWTTGFRGRSYRGRTYHIGLCEIQVLNNEIIPETVSDLIGAYGELIALDTDVGPGIMCIASRFHNKVQRVTGVATPVTDLAVDPVIDSQRRRLPGRGR